MATEAGKGEHRVYRIVPNSPDHDPLMANHHYFGVDAVAWFINKDSSWFTDRMASGTLDLSIASVEKYEAALGTFELKDGSHIAPVFDRPVLPDRNYTGGFITFDASLTAIKKDTVIAGILKSAAAASLDVVQGMVQTATAAGPAQILGAAGGELIGGVKKFLSDTKDKREPIFDFSGIEITLQPEKIVGPEIYLLLHRGALLDEKSLSVQPQGQLTLPTVNGVILDDGAWLLLRLRRTLAYSGTRDWFSAARALRNRIDNLVNDFKNNVISQTDALQQLKPSQSGSSTIFDEFLRLRAVIQNDGVLTEQEASLYVGQLRTQIVGATQAIQQGSPAHLDSLLKATRQALSAGDAMPSEAASAYNEEGAALRAFRRRTSVLYSRSELLAAEKPVMEHPVSFVTRVSLDDSLQGAVEESFRK
jgi:hypothetical protein